MVILLFRLILFTALIFSYGSYSAEHVLNIANFTQEWKAFLSSYEKESDSDDLEIENSLDDEFSLLEEFSEEQSLRYRPYIQSIDRFEDCRPYVENHVTLLDGTRMSASFILLGEGKPNYHQFIATQAPFQHNIHLFWQMILENHIDQIIMLTECFEVPSKELAYPYWPQKIGEKLILENGIEITLNEQQLLLQELKESILIRKFDVRTNDENKVVTHYWYRNWPDNTSPKQSQTITTLIKTVEKDKDDSASPSPILIHCAAGVGRTGVFITLYHLMQRVKHDDQKIKLIDLIAYLRWQRPYMVGVCSQYKFCYTEATRLYER